MDNTITKFLALSSLVFGIVSFLSVPLITYAQQSVKSNSVITKVGDAKEEDRPRMAAGAKQPAPVSNNFREDILKEFGIDMQGFGEAQLRFAWEKFWDVKHTNFNKLVHGRQPVVKILAKAESKQINCGEVWLQNFPQEEFFKIIIIHELGHIIYHCNNDSENLVTEHKNVYKQEGEVTKYGRDVGGGVSCLGEPSISENYPEMIAYYLNQNSAQQTAKCATSLPGPNSKPYENNAKPLHFNLAKRILGEY